MTRTNQPRRQWVLWGAVLALFCAAADARAASEIRAGTDVETAYINEPFNYQVVIANLKNPPAPDMTALQADFNILGMNGPSTQTSISIFNGQRSQEISYQYVYSLAAKRAGQIPLPGPSVTVDGKTYTARGQTLRVAAPEKQDTVIVELSASPAKIYPTQPFEVILRILVRPLPNVPTRDPLNQVNPPLMALNWVDPPAGLSSPTDVRTWLGALQARTGRGFAVRYKPPAMFDDGVVALNLHTGAREIRKAQDGSSINYFVYELKRTFTAEKAGAYTFGPVSIKGGFVEGFDGRQYTGRNLYVVAEPFVVEARDVPTPRPPTFCGGLGPHAVKASVNGSALRVGDPLSLTLEVERQQGAGSLDLVSAPDLSLNDVISADFNIIDKKPTGSTKENAKSFTYGLRPKRAGASIPPLMVSFFNPATEKFEEQLTAAIPLSVTESAALSPDDLVGAASTGVSRELRSKDQGVFQNVLSVSELRDQSVNPTTFAALAAGLWVAFGAFAFWIQRHRRLSGDSVWQRRQRARRDADAHLAAAREAFAKGTTETGTHEIYGATIGLIGDMLNIPDAGMTSREAGDALKQVNVSEENRKGAVGLLESIEALKYGSTGSEGSKLLADAERLLPALHRELEGIKR